MNTTIFYPIAPTNVHHKSMPLNHRVPTLENDVLRECQLVWWTVRGYDEICESGRLSQSINARYERRGWLGLTITGMSPLEDRAIKAWVKNTGSDQVYCSRKYTGYGEPKVIEVIGEFRGYSYVLWFTDEQIRDQCVEMLKGFQKRTHIMVINNVGAIKQFVSGTNYLIIKGQRLTVLAYGNDVNEVDQMLLRITA